MRVGVTGHQSIPTEAKNFVMEHIKNEIPDDSDHLVGISSLAIGADQLFTEIILSMGGSIIAVIPCAKYEDTFKDSSALRRFRQLLNLAENVEELDHDRPSEEAFLEAGQRVVDHSEKLIAVWDGDAARGKGGTGDIVRYARDQGVEVVVIWPEGMER